MCSIIICQRIKNGNQFIKGNKVALGAFRKTVRKLRVAAYCRVSTDSEDQIKVIIL